MDQKHKLLRRRIPESPKNWSASVLISLMGLLVSAIAIFVSWHSANKVNCFAENIPKQSMALESIESVRSLINKSQVDFAIKVLEASRMDLQQGDASGLEDYKTLLTETLTNSIRDIENAKLAIEPFIDKDRFDTLKQRVKIVQLDTAVSSDQEREAAIKKYFGSIANAYKGFDDFLANELQIKFASSIAGTLC